MRGKDLLEKATAIAKRHELLASEIRVMILATLRAMGGEASWTGLKQALETLLERPLNPNLLAFHLRRLTEAGVVGRREIGREVYYDLVEDMLSNEAQDLVRGIAERLSRDK